MIRNVRKLRKPPAAELGEHFALAGYRIRENAVKGRDAVGRDNEQFIAEIEDFADFAAAKFGDAGKVAGQEIHVRNQEIKILRA